MRKAADPGMVERIAGFLSDNPLTHSWRDSVGGAINWAERQVASDDDLRQHIGNVLSKSYGDKGISDETLAVLETLKGAPIERALFEQAMAEHPQGPAHFIGRSATGYAEQAGLGADQLRAVLSGIQGPLQQRGNVAHGAALLATHPAVAYSAVTAGGAMGTAAGMEAYKWWMAQQQQAQKESQLPLEEPAVLM